MQFQYVCDSSISKVESLYEEIEIMHYDKISDISKLNKVKKGYTPITRAMPEPSKLMEPGWKGEFDIDHGVNDMIRILKEISI